MGFKEDSTIFGLRVGIMAIAAILVVRTKKRKLKVVPCLLVGWIKY